MQLFDGIIKGTGLIIIITTNNIEKLDKVLIREGRISKHIHMTKMTKNEANKLINYHFLGNYNIDIENLKFTPAKIENICLESKNINEFKEKIFSFLN